MASELLQVLRDYGPVPALILQAAIFWRFLNAKNRDYPLAILFMGMLILVTSISHFLVTWAKALLAPDLYRSLRSYFVSGYSGAELLMYILLLILMLQLIRRTLRALSLDTSITVHLGFASALIAAGSWFYFSNEGARGTLLKTRQIVSFWMMLLNLYWWTLLLRRRQLDRRVLLLSAGIGLMMTGQVVSDGLSAFFLDSQEIRLIGAAIMYATHYASLYVWFQAFSPSLALTPAATSTSHA